MSKVKVELTNRRAIYVDGQRITNRGTKWGDHITVHSFSCKRKNVLKKCLERGFEKWTSNIDDPEFMEIK